MSDANSRMPLVIIPCRNESANIAKVVSDVKRAMPCCDIAVIDDDSSDSSAEQACNAGASVLGLRAHLGYGAALETGYIYAARHGYRHVLQMDGDGQHSANGLHALLQPVENGEADLVIGSRYLGGEKAETPLLRRAGHRLFAGIIRVLTGLHLSDPISGFQALGPRALKFLSSGVFPCDYPDADVIAMAYFAGLRIIEVPATMRARTDGRSMHGGLEPLYYGIKMTLSLLLVLLNFRTWQAWKADMMSTGRQENS